MGKAIYVGRILIGFIAAALVAPVVVLLADRSFGFFWFTMIGSFSVPLALVVGYPLFIVLRRRGFITLPWCVGAGAIISGLGVLIFGAVTNELAAVNWAPGFLIIGVVSAMAFWLIAVWKNVRPET